MSYEKVNLGDNIIIGTKQSTKAVEMGKATEVIIAEDADPHITAKMINLCKKMGVKVTFVDSMKKLGKTCGIEVGAAMATIVNE